MRASPCGAAESAKTRIKNLTMDVVIVTLKRDSLKYAVEAVNRVIPDPNIIFVTGKGVIGDLRNKGLAQCSSPYCAFVDDDVVVNEDWFRICMEQLKNPELVVVGGKVKDGYTLGCVICKTEEFKRIGGWPRLDSYISNKYGSKIGCAENTACNHIIPRGLRGLHLKWLFHGFQTENRAGFYHHPREIIKTIFRCLWKRRPEGIITQLLYLVKIFFILPFLDWNRILHKNKKENRELTKLSSVIRFISFPFRYFLVLGLAKLLTPTLFKEIFNPKVYGEQRPMIKHLQEHYGHGLMGAEIGVFKGVHARSMLQNLKLNKLYLVDPYLPYFQKGEWINPFWAKSTARHVLKPFRNQVVWTTNTELPANLDFVYIDGNHEYDAVKKDLLIYHEKVRCGGTLGGHDFTSQFPGVIKAVTEFVAEQNYDLFVADSDWWIIKQ